MKNGTDLKELTVRSGIGDHSRNSKASGLESSKHTQHYNCTQQLSAWGKVKTQVKVGIQ